MSRYNSRLNRPTFEQVSAVLGYSPETGKFWWKVPRKGVAFHKYPGNVDSVTGYRRISVCGTPQAAAHLAWLLTYGEWPTSELDHINRVRDDDRIDNLRPANRSQQAMNTTIRADNTTGFKGVSFNKRREMQCKPAYEAYIAYSGRKIHLGFHETKEVALIARKAAETKLFGEYAN